MVLAYSNCSRIECSNRSCNITAALVIRTILSARLSTRQLSSARCPTKTVTFCCVFLNRGFIVTSSTTWPRTCRCCVDVTCPSRRCVSIHCIYNRCKRYVDVEAIRRRPAWQMHRWSLGKQASNKHFTASNAFCKSIWTPAYSLPSFWIW